MRFALYWIGMGLCSFLVFLGAAGILLSPYFPGRAGDAGYLLQDCGGRVALVSRLDPQAPQAVYDIYVNLLPECTALRLKAGWPVPDQAEAERVLNELSSEMRFTLQKSGFSAINKEEKLY